MSVAQLFLSRETIFLFTIQRCLPKSAATADQGDIVAQTQKVAIANMRFNPQNVSVAAGDMVEWTNQMSMAHTVTADDDSFDSGALGKNLTFSQPFNTPGTVSYHCNIHPFMTGSVIVGAAGHGGNGGNDTGQNDGGVPDGKK
jgi:plastocyanin